MKKLAPNKFRKMLATPALIAAFALASCAEEITDPYAAGLAAVEVQDLQAARLYLRQAMELTPEDKAIQLDYAKVLLAMGNPEGAITQLSGLVDQAEAMPEIPGLLAKAHLLAENPRAALASLEETGLQDGLSYAVMVGAYLNLGDADAALVKLDEGLSEFPDSVDLAVLDANRSFDVRDLPQARLRLGMALSEQPDHVEARMLGGRIELYDRQFAAARVHFEQILEIQPWNMPALVSIVAMERDMGNNDAALEWLNKAKSIAPNHPIAAYFSAQMAFDDGDVNEALALLQSIPAESADIPAIWLLRGQISASRDQAYTAISEFERFFQRGGEANLPRLQLAQLHRSVGENAKAWQVIEPALSSYSADEATLSLGAELAAELGRPEIHQIAERTRVLRDQTRYDGEMRAASNAISSGDWETAGRLYAEILAMAEESNPVVLNNAANVQLRLGNKSAALDLASRAYSLAPQDPIIMDTMGWSMVQADGRSPRAIALIQQAFELAPDNREIADHLIIVGRNS